MGSIVASYRPTKVSTGGTRQAPRTLPQPSWLLLIVITATVAGLVWGLMQQQRPQIDPRQVIAINLAAGELAFKHERFVEPADHSAAHYFNAVLALDPDQPRALRGLQQISEHFADRAKLAILDSRFADAAVAIEQLRRINADERRLGLLEIELRKALDTHVATLAEIAANTETAAIKTATPNAADQDKPNNARGAMQEAGDGGVVAPTRLSDSAQAVQGSTVAAGSAFPGDANLVANEARSENPVDEAAEQQLATSLMAQTEASPFDVTQFQMPARETDTTARRLTLIEEPLLAPGAQMATTPPATPIEVSARWLPQAVKLVEPHYPQAAQVRGIEGWVDLMITVAPTGEVIEAQVRDREGSRSFERAALFAVRQWRYEPNAAGSSAPVIEIPVRVAFKLE